MAPTSWTSKEPTKEVLAKLRSFLDLPAIDDDGVFMVQKLMKLIANKLSGARRLRFGQRSSY
jgi:hypothetical protein